MDCGPPGSSVCGILKARILEWVATPSSRGSSQPGTEPMSLTSPALAGGFFTTSTSREAPVSWYKESSLVPHAPCPTRIHRGPAPSSHSGSQADEGLASLTTCVEESLEICVWASHVSDRKQYTSSFLLTSHWPGPVTSPHPSATEPGNVSKQTHSLECVSLSSIRSLLLHVNFLSLKSHPEYISRMHPMLWGKKFKRSGPISSLNN